MRPPLHFTAPAGAKVASREKTLSMPPRRARARAYLAHQRLPRPARADGPLPARRRVAPLVLWLYLLLSSALELRLAIMDRSALRTQFSIQASTLADSYRSTVGRLRVGPHGYCPDMTAPEVSLTCPEMALCAIAVDEDSARRTDPART